MRIRYRLSRHTSMGWLPIAIVACVCAFVIEARAQSMAFLNETLPADTNITTVTSKDVQFSIPAGVTGQLGTGEDGSEGASALIGLQFRQKDLKWAGSLYFGYAGPKTVSGGPSVFGSYFLNPTTEGSYFDASGHYLLGKKPFNWGISGHLGMTQTKWQSVISDSLQEVSGSIVSLTLSGVILSKPIPLEIGGAENELRLGLELGTSMRFFAGDLGQDEMFRSSSLVLGFDDGFAAGFEVTGYAVVNSIQPYFKVTVYPKHGGHDTPGFSGMQLMLGVNTLGQLFKAGV